MPLIETANGSIWYADHRDPTLHRPVTLVIHGAGGTHLDCPAEIRRMPELNAISLICRGMGIVPAQDVTASGRTSVICWRCWMLSNSNR